MFECDNDEQECDLIRVRCVGVVRFVAGLPGPKRLKRSKTDKSLSLKRPNFLQKIVKITRFKVGISNNITNFALIFSKQALKYPI